MCEAMHELGGVQARWRGGRHNKPREADVRSGGAGAIRVGGPLLRAPVVRC